MPDESDPSYARWSPAIRREMADLDDGAIVAGHSVAATILVNALAEQPPERGLGAIVLIAAPFVGDGGWPGDEFELTSTLGARLPPGVRVHLFHGLQDETAPPSQGADLGWGRLLDHHPIYGLIQSRQNHTRPTANAAAAPSQFCCSLSRLSPRCQGSGLCKYGLQRYLPPLRQTSSLTNPAQSTTQPVVAAGEP